MTGPFRFQATLWEHEGEAAWFFVTLPSSISDEIADLVPPRPGFGSVRVEVEVGETVWRTSLPDKAAASYVLPVKRQVREAEGLSDGDAVEVSIDLV